MPVEIIHPPTCEGKKGLLFFCLFYNWQWNEIMKPQHPCGTQQCHIPCDRDCRKLGGESMGDETRGG